MPAADTYFQQTHSENILLLIKFAHLNECNSYSNHYGTAHIMYGEEDEKREGRALDTLALLMDAGDPTDMFAVTMRRDRGGLSLVFAKSTAPSTEDQRVVRELLSHIIHPDITTWQDLFHRFTLHRCGKTLNTKLRGLSDALGNVVSSERFQEVVRAHETLHDESDASWLATCAQLSGSEGAFGAGTFSGLLVELCGELGDRCRQGISSEDPRVAEDQFGRILLLVGLLLGCQFLRNINLDPTAKQYDDILDWACQLVASLQEVYRYKEDIEFTLLTLKQLFDGHARISHEWIGDVLNPDRPSEVVPGRDLAQIIVGRRSILSELVPPFKEENEDLFREWAAQEPVQLCVHPELQIMLYFRAQGLTAAGSTENVGPGIIGTSRPCCLSCGFYIAKWNKEYGDKWRTTTVYAVLDPSWALPTFPFPSLDDDSSSTGDDESHVDDFELEESGSNDPDEADLDDDSDQPVVSSKRHVAWLEQIDMDAYLSTLSEVWAMFEIVFDCMLGD